MSLIEYGKLVYYSLLILSLTALGVQGAVLKLRWPRWRAVQTTPDSVTAYLARRQRTAELLRLCCHLAIFLILAVPFPDTPWHLWLSRHPWLSVTFFGTATALLPILLISTSLIAITSQYHIDHTPVE